jgi:hypothetical protein
MHLLGLNATNGEHLLSLFNKLCVDKSSLPRHIVPNTLPSTPIYELDPLPEYCIDHPHLGNLLLFKVPMQQHPWGVNAILCNKDNQLLQFKDWTLCLYKVGWGIVTYVHIGGWWIESTHDNQ